jgi:F-type H+-transporting ATPase subunit delta
MSDFRVASRYARSVFDLAIELNVIEKIYNDMILLEQVCKDNRKLVVLLKNPIVRFDYKLRIIRKIFSKHVDQVTLKFFDLICRKNRASILPEVSRVFIMFYHDYKGIVSADVSAAVELSDSLKKEFEGIVGRATGKKVELETTVDESLLGGFVLRVGDNQVDSSIKSKLNNLRRQLKSRP